MNLLQEKSEASPPLHLRSTIKAMKDGIKSARLHREVGEITDISGSRIATTLRDVFVGEKCILRIPATGKEIIAQVVAIESERAVLSPLEEIDGIARDTKVFGTGEPCKIHVGPELVGRVLDGLGHPLDRKPMATDRMQNSSLLPKATNALDYGVIDDIFETGVKSIDGFNTVGQGQRLAIFGEAGAGKSTLLSMLARHSESDVVVLAMIGERSREVNEFLERQMPEEVRNRCVVVVATSDRPAMERIMAAHCAASIAEHFRSEGKDVLFLFDSMTRYARALREVGLASGEKAVRSGFTPSVYAELPRLIERSGKTESGAITSFYTVLVENNGVNDPIAEEVASLTDGHLILDAELARSGLYPAINVLKSKSRLMNEIGDPGHVKSANRLRKLMAKFQDMELLIQMGEYVKGTDPIADQAIAVNEPLREYLSQDTHDKVPHQAAINGILELANE